MNNKVDELQILLDSFDILFDFVTISESWLNSDFCLTSLTAFAMNRVNGAVEVDSC